MKALYVGLCVLWGVAMPGLASAECKADADCAEEEVCMKPVAEAEPGQGGSAGDPADASGQCQPKGFGNACYTDADCSGGLVCTHVNLCLFDDTDVGTANSANEMPAAEESSGGCSVGGAPAKAPFVVWLSLLGLTLWWRRVVS